MVKELIMKVLAVDDDMVNRMVFGAFLGKVRETMLFDYEVAESGLEALQKCASTQFDIVFMDIMMPEMDGYEAIGAIKQIYKLQDWEFPLFVMVTACDTKEAVLKAHAAGAVGFLMKPVNKNEVVDWFQIVVMDGGCRASMPGDVGLDNI